MTVYIEGSPPANPEEDLVHQPGLRQGSATGFPVKEASSSCYNRLHLLQTADFGLRVSLRRFLVSQHWRGRILLPPE